VFISSQLILLQNAVGGSPLTYVDFDFLYDEEYFLDSLRNSSCIFRNREIDQSQLQPLLPYPNVQWKSGWYFVAAVNRIRHQIGSLESTTSFGVLPETPVEKQLQYQIFDAFKLNSQYQQLADQYLNYVSEAATAKGGYYCAIHLRIEVDWANRRVHPSALIEVVDNEIDHETTTVMYIAMGLVEPHVAKPYLVVLCDNRPWTCLRKEDIPISTSLIINFDTAFTIEVHLLKHAHTAILDRISTMSWVVMGERMKNGRDYVLWGNPDTSLPEQPAYFRA